MNTDEMERLGYHCEMLAHSRCVSRGCSCDCHTRAQPAASRPVPVPPPSRMSEDYRAERPRLSEEEKLARREEGWAKEHALDGGYAAEEVMNLTGLSYRQLDYWSRTGYLTPSLMEANGSGTRRRYSENDLRTAQLTKTLLDAGLSLQRLRGLGDSLATVPAETPGIVAIGETIHVVTSAEQLLGLIHAGQVLHVVRTGP